MIARLTGFMCPSLRSQSLSYVSAIFSNVSEAGHGTFPCDTRCKGRSL